MNPSQYVKAFVGAVVAGGGSAVTALQDGHVTSGEAVAIIVATAVGFGAVFQIPNATAPQQEKGTPVFTVPQTFTTVTAPPVGGGGGSTWTSAARPPDDPGAPDGATEVR